MKPKKFMPGQAVTVNKNKPFKTIRGPENNTAPRFGEIVHVLCYSEFYYGNWFLGLREYSFCNIAYNEDDFDPVITATELEKELSEIETGVVV